MHTRTVEETIDNLKTIFAYLPAEARRPVTFNNGLAFYEHQKLKKGLLNIETYFYDPYSSWQKAGLKMQIAYFEDLYLKAQKPTIALPNKCKHI